VINLSKFLPFFHT